MFIGLSFRQVSENLHVDQNGGNFTYSDGKKDESHLLDIVGTAQNLSSTSWELHETADTWVERYHLSIHRAAIIRCLSFDPNLRVLEIGAGTGAITRALGEKFSRVDAIEGSIDRARVCATRCRDLPNVRVFAANINRISPEPLYDLVFLIGVLEWSRGFIEDSDPVHRCLQIASAALKKDGKLVVAIENQIGLKYFLGSGEDHCGIPMESLHGYPNFDKAETFSRFKLSRLLKEAGLPNSRFMYPFPDYKLAKVVLTDEAVSLCSESIAYWASRYKFEDYQVPDRYCYGNQFLIASEVAKAGLLGELSNSFLVIAGKEEAVINDPSWLVWSERVVRNMTLCSTTTLEEVDDQLAVRKEYPYLSSQEPPDSSVGFYLKPQLKQPFFDGSTLEMELLRCAISGRSDDFLRIVTDWVAYVRKNLLVADGLNVHPEAWDCIPRNLIRLPSGELVAFDLEFRNNRPFKLEELCGRGLLSWFCDHAQSTMDLYPEAKTIRNKMDWVLSTIFTNMESGSIIDSVVRSETSFQRWVNPGEILDIDSTLNAPIRSGVVDGYLTLRLRAKEEELARLQEHAARLQQFSDTVRQTVVYRLYRSFIKPFKAFLRL